MIINDDKGGGDRAHRFILTVAVVQVVCSGPEHPPHRTEHPS